MFGYSIIKTKKLERLYDSAAEMAARNVMLKKRNDALLRYCDVMRDKLEEFGIIVPEWWFMGL